MAWIRRLRRSWWCVLPLLVLAVGVGWLSGKLARNAPVSSGGPPIIDYPSVIDLGQRTANEEILSRFDIFNRGGQELVVSKIRASCSCGSLEREVSGRYEPIEELRLASGERAAVMVRTAVRVDGAGAFSQMVFFLTNDPDQPEGRVTLVFRTESGGVRVRPNSVVFGRLRVGIGELRLLDVVDPDQKPQAITRVVSADPSRVAVRWLPRAGTPTTRDDGALLGQIEVVPNTSEPLLLDTSISVEFADPKIRALTIQVSGRVAPTVEVTPPSIVLPRSTGDGPVYTASCVVYTAEDGGAVGLELESASPGLKVEIPDSAQGAVWVVRITWLRDAGDAAGSPKKLVRLRAKVGEQSQTLEIPVTCEEP